MSQTYFRHLCCLENDRFGSRLLCGNSRCFQDKSTGGEQNANYFYTTRRYCSTFTSCHIFSDTEQFSRTHANENREIDSGKVAPIRTHLKSSPISSSIENGRTMFHIIGAASPPRNIPRWTGTARFTRAKPRNADRCRANALANREDAVHAIGGLQIRGCDCK